MDRQKINEYLLEIDWKWAGIQYGITAIITAILSLLSIFSMKAQLGSLPIDKNLTKKINGILKGPKEFRVFIFKEKAPNAFCMFSPDIYVTSGLLKMCTEKELLAVCLHEAGHVNDHHSWYRAFAAIGLGALFHAMLRVWIHEKNGGYEIDHDPQIWMIELALTTQVTNVILARLQGRGQEYYADSYATKYGYGDYLISGLQKLQKWVDKVQPCNNKICKALRWLSEAMDEHPSVKDRVEAILKDKQKLKELGQLPTVKKIEYIKGMLNLEE
jgi:Zn-dependent protease with chaperone function